MEMQLFDWALEHDETEAQRGGQAEVTDQDVKVLLRENRLALWKGETERVTVAGHSQALVDLELWCVAHAHPKCRFRWVRLEVDFRSTPGAQVLDMSPREVLGPSPVEIETTRKLGLKFQVAEKTLGPEVSAEQKRKRTVYFPEITSSGEKLSRAVWSFTALQDADLYVDRQLRLLVQFPGAQQELQARFQLRAEVALAGWPGAIPLVGRKEKEVQVLYRLD